MSGNETVDQVSDRQKWGSEGSSELKIAMLSIHSCPLGKVGGENTGGMSVYIRELVRELGRRGHLVDVYTRIHEPIHDQVVELGENARLIHLKAGEEETHKLQLYSHVGDFARNLEKELVKDCHRIIASTERGKEDLITYYDAAPETISIIPCGVNLDLFRPIKRETARCHLGLNGESIIVFVGRIIPLKGIDNILKAMAYLEGKRRIKLVVIGGDDHSQAEIQRLKNLSRSLKIDESVIFLGSVKQEMLPFFYSAADLCVVPSYYESFGLVVLESLACGTPVVATKVGCAESVIRYGDTGYVVTDNDPCCLADKISRLLSTPNGKTDFVRSVRASVAKYSWSNISEAIIEEYRSVLWDFSARGCKGTQEFRV